jgi:hypothetical protein
MCKPIRFLQIHWLAILMDKADWHKPNDPA